MDPKHDRIHEDLNRELQESGELVDSQGLVDPSQATTVRFQKGAPVPTDGPFAEAKESLAGYLIIDATAERATEIASRISRPSKSQSRCVGWPTHHRKSERRRA